MADSAVAMIYGANGYTGRLIAREAARQGLKPILAGRNRVEVEALATQLDCPNRVFALDDASAVTFPILGACDIRHRHVPP